MANIKRIRRLDPEIDLKNVVIPVDKDSYLSNCKYITILDLKTFILSGYTGNELYTSKYPVAPYWTAGGIIAGDSRFPSGFNNVRVRDILDLMLYPVITTTTTLPPTTTTTTTLPPTTTTTTTLPPTTTTTTTLPPTTTTTTLPPTTTSTTLPPTTTSTTTIPFWTYTVISDIDKVNVCSSIIVDTVYSGDNFWQSGMFLYLDTALTIPYSGSLIIKEEFGSILYDLLGGNNVGNQTGDSC